MKQVAGAGIHLLADGQIEHISYCHLPTGARFDLWRGVQPGTADYGWNWRWSTDQGDPSSAFGNDAQQERRPFSKDFPRELWDRMADKLKRGLLRHMYNSGMRMAGAESGKRV